MSDQCDDGALCPQVYIARAGAGERIVASGVDHLFALGAERSAGKLSVETFTVPPAGLGAPLHIHGSHDECFVVLEGELTLMGASGETLLRRGDLAYAPRGSAHGFRNAQEALPVTALCISTPAGYEHFFRDVAGARAAGVVLDAAATADLREGYDTRTV